MKLLPSRVIDINGVSFAQFDDPITVYEGTSLIRVYNVDTSIKQRFIIDSPNIDSSTLRVFVSGTNDVHPLEENIQWLIIF